MKSTFVCALSRRHSNGFVSVEPLGPRARSDVPSRVILPPLVYLRKTRSQDFSFIFF